jgi:hypothetical protein
MTTKELHQRRAELSALLPGLALTRDYVFQLKCDAERLDRFGVTHHTAAEMARLAEDQAAAEARVRALQLQLRDVDDENQERIRRWPHGDDRPRPAARMSRFLR